MTAMCRGGGSRSIGGRALLGPLSDPPGHGRLSGSGGELSSPGPAQERHQILDLVRLPGEKKPQPVHPASHGALLMGVVQNRVTPGFGTTPSFLAGEAGPARRPWENQGTAGTAHRPRRVPALPRLLPGRAGQPPSPRRRGTRHMPGRAPGAFGAFSSLVKPAKGVTRMASLLNHAS
jgi:hypothetical protein